MPTTEHIHLPLYTDEETPDLSTTGHYNHAMEILDANVGELEAKDAELAKDIADEREARIAGDSELDAKLAAETKARTDADTALGARIDNAETEISANSADLTGIKGLTYGSDHVQFIENENGSYTSPALEEIAEQIANASGGMTIIEMSNSEWLGKLSAEHMKVLEKNWPNVMVFESTFVHYPLCGGKTTYEGDPEPGFYFYSLALSNYPTAETKYNEVNCTKVVAKSGSRYGECLEYSLGVAPAWHSITEKPFDRLGPEFSTETSQAGKVLRVNALSPTSTWGEIEQS